MGGARGATTSRGRARRWASILVLAGVATLGLSSCGGDSSQTGGAIMGIDVTFTPNPATAVPSDLEGYEWVAPFTVTLRETGGLGGSITNIIVNVYENVDGVQGAEGPSNTLLEYQSLRLEAGGTRELIFNTHYSLPNEEKAALVDLFIFVIDDAGFSGQVGQRYSVQ